MERLTERIKRPQKDDLIVYTNGKYEDTIPAEMTNDDIRAVLKKLADYEDLEEQGLLVRFDAIGKEDMGESCYRLEDIGRIVFLTHEEAEKKLEESQNGKK